MRCLITFVAAFCLVSGASAADASIRIPTGMRVAADAYSISASKAELECNLFKASVANGKVEDAKKVATGKSLSFNLGSFQSLDVAFPTPYESVHIIANHARSAFGETDPHDFKPYMQAFFLKDDQWIGQLKDVTFAIDDARAGSELLLRDTYNFDPSAMLIYQCVFRYL